MRCCVRCVVMCVVDAMVHVSVSWCVGRHVDEVSSCLRHNLLYVLLVTFNVSRRLLLCRGGRFTNKRKDKV